MNELVRDHVGVCTRYFRCFRVQHDLQEIIERQVLESINLWPMDTKWVWPMKAVVKSQLSIIHTVSKSTCITWVGVLPSHDNVKKTLFSPTALLFSQICLHWFSCAEPTEDSRLKSQILLNPKAFKFRTRLTIKPLKRAYLLIHMITVCAVCWDLHHQSNTQGLQRECWWRY